MPEKSVLTIIPARGGSKGIPQKSIRMLAGKPLIAWTIEEAHKAKLTGRVIVSTDSEEIAEVAREYGAEVPFMRPPEISKDLSTDLEFVLHALSFFEEREKWVPDAVARFSPTTPLRNAKVMDDAIELLLKNPDIDSVRPISLLSHHPYKAWKIEGEFIRPAFDGAVTGHAEPHNMPRQLFPQLYAHLGASGVAWTPVFREKRSTSGEKIKYTIIDEREALDINTPLDFDIAEFLMLKRLKEKS